MLHMLSSIHMQAAVLVELHIRNVPAQKCCFLFKVLSYGATVRFIYRFHMQSGPEF